MTGRAARHLDVLLVEDNRHDAALLQEALGYVADARIGLHRVDCLAAAVARLGDAGADVVLLDLGLPDSSGLATLDAVQAAAPGLAVVVLTGLQDEDLGTEAVRRGAQDYLVKGALDGAAVVRALRYAHERKQGEERLKEALSTLEGTLESTNDGLLVVDCAGRILTFNQRLVRMWDLPSEALAPRDEERILHHILGQVEEPEAFLARVREVVAQPGAESFDEVRVKDGRVFERYSQPRRIGGQPVGRVWSFRDVTERRRTEAERLRSMERLKEVEQLREMDRFKTRFINMAAHELGTPLTPIRVQLHMLRTTDAAGLSDRQHKSVAILQRNVERLAQLVGDVLEGARLQAGKLSVKRTPVDLGRVAGEAVESFHESARETGVRLALRLDGDLIAEADGKRILQVLFNLLGNALKFTPRGGRVDVAVTGRDADVEVSVSDTGVGIRTEDIPRLFQPFSQVHDSAEPRGGTGLGLYISRNLIELHGGTIAAASAGVGRGATFTFTIPRRARPDLPPGPGEALRDDRPPRPGRAEAI